MGGGLSWWRMGGSLKGRESPARSYCALEVYQGVFPDVCVGARGKEKWKLAANQLLLSKDCS